MVPSAVSKHLRGTKCLKVHHRAEALELAKSAPRDVEPFVARVRELEAMREDAKDRKKAAQPEFRDGWDAVVIACNKELDRIQRLGPNKYEPPAGYYDEKG
jgi:hypothetical protein